MSESSDGAGAGMVTGAIADPAYREAVIDLMGAIAYGELSAFERLVSDARMSPTLADKLALGSMAAVQFGHVQPLLDRIAALGGDPVAALEPFAKAFDVFHAKTAPSDWLEGLVKAFVGDGLANDFYAEIAVHLEPTTRDLVLAVMERTRDGAQFLVSRVRAGIEADPKAAGRLALWARRLVGEALSQAQQVAAERDELAEWLAGGDGFDLAEIAAMFSRLTAAHADRMAELGLTP